jgi:hypothetical protein
MALSGNTLFGRNTVDPEFRTSIGARLHQSTEITVVQISAPETIPIRYN